MVDLSGPGEKSVERFKRCRIFPSLPSLPLFRKTWFLQPGSTLSSGRAKVQALAGKGKRARRRLTDLRRLRQC